MVRFAECSLDGFAPEDYAQPVVVAANRTTAGIDAGLQRGATISGRVTDAEVQPVRRACVSAGGQFAVTATDGTYTIAGLLPGAYTIAFRDCDHRGYASTEATTTVEEGEDVDDIDAVLGKLGRISGTVTTTSGVAAGACVKAASTSGHDAVVDGDGHYAIDDLEPGEYTVEFYDCDGSGLDSETAVPRRSRWTRRRTSTPSTDTTAPDTAFTSDPSVSGKQRVVRVHRGALRRHRDVRVQPRRRCLRSLRDAGGLRGPGSRPAPSPSARPTPSATPTRRR